jgi:polyferredoxin
MPARGTATSSCARAASTRCGRCFALWTGFTFVGFFTPITDLAARLAPFQWGGWETFWVLFYAFATWGNAGFLREQVCKYMCPYARFQSAMFDRDTLLIAYDPMRGEPRGPRKRGLGDVMARGRGLLSQVLAYDFVFRASHHPTAADKRCRRAARSPSTPPTRNRCRNSRRRNWATASIARSACRSAPPASTSATACNTSASPAAPAWTPATK